MPPRPPPPIIPVVATDRVCIIGAGSSGITALKVLREHGLEAVCFEKGSGIGGNWRYGNDNGLSAAYSSLHINTSKKRMAYSDFPMPEEYPDYPHHSQILRYFEAYADRFGLREHIRFRRTVESVRPEGGRWRVSVRGAAEDRSDLFRAVLVCNGHHWRPKLPNFPGNFDGHTLHSHSYREPSAFEEKRVVVVGMGNSGVDIVCELSAVAARTFLSARRGAHVLPKYVWGRPVDKLASPLMSRMPLALQRTVLQAVVTLARGRQERRGVPRPSHHLLQAHPTLSEELLDLVAAGRIETKPDIERFDGRTVHFRDGSREEVDAIVFATGYRLGFPFLAPELIDPERNEVRLYRNVVHPHLPGLFFIGLIQPLGAIMPLAEAQSQWVAELLAGECALPPVEGMLRACEDDRAALRRRYVSSTRHTIQVDFFPYLRTIRREIRQGRRARSPS